MYATIDAACTVNKYKKNQVVRRGNVKFINRSNNKSELQQQLSVQSASLHGH